jgi:hypothetical protein
MLGKTSISLVLIMHERPRTANPSGEVKTESNFANPQGKVEAPMALLNRKGRFGRGVQLPVFSALTTGFHWSNSVRIIFLGRENVNEGWLELEQSRARKFSEKRKRRVV